MSALHRGNAIAAKFVEKMFSGTFEGRQGRHLSPDEIRELVITVYTIGFDDGRKVKPPACESCGTVTSDLKRFRFTPGVLTPPGENPKVPSVDWFCAECGAKVMGG